jgi:hypothetical protein
VANYVGVAGDDADFVEALKLWARIHVPKGLDEHGDPR